MTLELRREMWSSTCRDLRKITSSRWTCSQRKKTISKKWKKRAERPLPNEEGRSRKSIRTSQRRNSQSRGSKRRLISTSRSWLLQTQMLAEETRTRRTCRILAWATRVYSLETSQPVILLSRRSVAAISMPTINSTRGWLSREPPGSRSNRSMAMWLTWSSMLTSSRRTWVTNLVCSRKWRSNCTLCTSSDRSMSSTIRAGWRISRRPSSARRPRPSRRTASPRLRDFRMNATKKELDSLRQDWISQRHSERLIWCAQRNHLLRLTCARE